MKEVLRSKALSILLFILLILIVVVEPVHSQQVHNRTSSMNYFFITNALKDAIPGDLIEVDPGIYNENILITNAFITLRATAWTQFNDNNMTILEPGGNPAIIKLSNAMNSVIEGFTIKFAPEYGIEVTANSPNCEIKNNHICSNFSGGIFINGFFSSHCIIMSNIIRGLNQQQGIIINGAEKTMVFRNLITQHEYNGITIFNSSLSNQIFNNTIFYSVYSNGVNWDNSTGSLLNNIIASNCFYGADCNTSSVYIAYNIFSGNIQGPTNGTSIQHGPRNFVQDPMADTAGFFQITSPLSFAVDSGTNIIPWTGMFFGLGPDMGWIESMHVFDFSVVNTTLGQGYYTIQEALDHALTGNMILVSPGTYNEPIIIANKMYLYLFSEEWNAVSDNRNTFIDGSGAQYAVTLANCRYVYLSGFSIKNASESGIFIEGTSSTNFIAANRICSNNINGIRVEGVNNQIIGNSIYGPLQETGIFVSNASWNSYLNNKIFSHAKHGVYIGDNSSYNLINENDIFSNTQYGLKIAGEFSDNNMITFNSFSGLNQSNGIYINMADNNEIYRNLIRDHDRFGVHLIGSDPTRLVNNTIYRSIGDMGVLWDTTSIGEMINNIIFSNGSGPGDYGVQLQGGAAVHLAYNDFYANYAPTNTISSSLIWGNGNIFANPLLNIHGDLSIISETSPAVDSASNVDIISNMFQGLAPDMGYMEFMGTGILSSYNSNLIFRANRWNLKGLLDLPPGADSLQSALSIMGVNYSSIYFWNAKVQEYQEPALFTSTENPAEGHGYWVYPLVNVLFQSPFIGDVPADAEFIKPLRPGWNLVSTPFRMICNVLKIRKNSAFHTWEEAASIGLVDPRIWGWDVSANGYYVTDRLNPWEGFWIWAEASCDLGIKASEQTASWVQGLGAGAVSLSSLGTTVALEKDQTAWVSRLGFSAKDRKDQYNVVGTSKGAKNEYSTEDAFKAPRVPGKNVRLELGDGLSYDIKKPVETISIWQFKAVSEYEYEDGYLEYDLTGIRDAGLYCLLAEKYSGKELVRTGAGSFKVNGGKNGINKEYVLKVATPEYAALLVGGIKVIDPKAYPNPVKTRERETIKIGYMISEESSVKLRIYDITGAEVKSADLDDRMIGKHIEIMNIRNLPSGVYIYEIKALSRISDRSDRARGKFVVIQ
ncbi:MAG: right-handed parallel beta-helix repeat-containing protein [Spirochaetes bacterium]|nr:right-handed parallel beta-helix repeat-containing protein [Spirochaetota bacterium]